MDREEAEASKNSEIIGATAGKDSSDDACRDETTTTLKVGHCLIDVKDGFRDDEENCSNGENLCRICHFGEDIEASSKEFELIQLGCDCKGELGSSHPHCADLWFNQKGNRICEICGKTAKNIKENNAEETTSIFMIDWEEMRLAAATLHAASERSYRHRHSKQFMCNLVLACFVLAAFIIWFFRGINIL